MDTNKPLSLFLVAILAASVFTVVGVSSLPVQNASAQDVTIETSADGHEGRFFGGMLQVTITDDDTNDDANDSIDVDVTVDEDGGNESPQTITVTNTREGSQRFEFFLVHTAADDLIPADPDWDGNSDCDDTDLDCVYEFGDGAADFNVADMDQFDSGSVEIKYGGETVTIDYDESSVEVTNDRETPYGSTSIVHVFVTDQDGNRDPTDRETYNVTAADLADLVDINGAFLSDDLVLEETSDNSAEFEAELQLTDPDDEDGSDNQLVFEEDVISIEVTDKVSYDDVDAAENDSTETDEITIEIDDADGIIDDVADPTFASELKVTVRDDDQNKDSEDDDVIEDGLLVQVDVAGGDNELLDLRETGDNTGVFAIDLGNDELKITFLADGDTPTDFNEILELRPSDIEDEDIFIEYNDTLDSDGEENLVGGFTVNMKTTPGQISAPESVGITDTFTVTVTDPDLNDNPRVRDSYEWNLDGSSDPDGFALTKGDSVFSDIYTLDMEIAGEDLEFDGESLTLSETGINTGIFEFEIDMQEDISDAMLNDLEIDDGDNFDLEISDSMSDFASPDDDSVSISIGRPSIAVDFSTTDPAIPPAQGSDVGDEMGNEVQFTMSIVDGSIGDSSNEDVLTLASPVDINDPGLAVYDEDDNIVGFIDISVDGDGFSCEISGEDGDTLDDCELTGGLFLDDILTTLENPEETGKTTHIFESDLVFTGTDEGDMSPSDWQDMEVEITYTNTNDDDDSAGFTFRGNDGIITVDQPSAKAGTVITVTVEDRDLNLDDGEIDSFESSLAAENPFIVALEAENDDIDQDDGDTQTFEETGDDTGVFTAEFEVGEDIIISDAAEGDQASNILVTYNDEVDSTGGEGEEIEFNVPVASGSGSIQVTPELVGPATTLTVLIIDSDLDEDANAADDYDPEDIDDAIEFSSSRNEVDEANPSIEETGPNTGVFSFELELRTDEDGCQDDDLDDPTTHNADFFDAIGDDTDSSIGACPGDLIAISYDDEHTSNGGSQTVSEVVEVKSWDPEFVADKDSYAVGDRVTVSISDPDGNRDSDIADSLTDIRVTSDSDRVGDEFSAIETGKDTGVFRLTFGTTSGDASGAIAVKTGDSITIEYTDEFPADFVDEEEDKDFEFVVPVGTSGTPETTTVIPPELQDVTGQEIDEVSAGQQVVLATSVRNNEASATPFVALIEVRDNNGVTIFLAWQTGTLQPNGQTNVGLSWTPEDSGDYTVRTFVISDLNNPRVLSPIAESDITVS